MLLYSISHRCSRTFSVSLSFPRLSLFRCLCLTSFLSIYLSVISTLVTVSSSFIQCVQISSTLMLQILRTSEFLGCAAWLTKYSPNGCLYAVNKTECERNETIHVNYSRFKQAMCLRLKPYFDGKYTVNISINSV